MSLAMRLAACALLAAASVLLVRYEWGSQGEVAFGIKVAPAPGYAEKADRFKPLNVEADQPGRIDLLNQHVVFNGNVVVTKGTMTIRAGRIEVRETPDGYHSAVAIGAAGKPATSRIERPTTSARPVCSVMTSVAWRSSSMRSTRSKAA